MNWLVGKVSSILVSAITKISMVSDIMGLKKSILFLIEFIYKYAMTRPLRFDSRIFVNAVFASSCSETDSLSAVLCTTLLVSASGEDEIGTLIFDKFNKFDRKVVPAPRSSSSYASLPMRV